MERREDIFETIKRAIEIAARDYPTEFKMRRHEIAQELFTCDLTEEKNEEDSDQWAGLDSLPLDFEDYPPTTETETDRDLSTAFDGVDDDPTPPTRPGKQLRLNGPGKGKELRLVVEHHSKKQQEEGHKRKRDGHEPPQNIKKPRKVNGDVHHRLTQKFSSWKRNTPCVRMSTCAAF